MRDFSEWAIAQQKANKSVPRFHRHRWTEWSNVSDDMQIRFCLICFKANERNIRLGY